MIVIYQIPETDANCCFCISCFVLFAFCMIRDEMSVYSSQSYEIAAEMDGLASTAMNIKSGQNGRLLVSLHQDALTGAFLSTKTSNNFETVISSRLLKHYITIFDDTFPNDCDVCKNILQDYGVEWSNNCDGLKAKHFLDTTDVDAKISLDKLRAMLPISSSMLSIICTHKRLIKKEIFFDCCCALKNIDLYMRIKHIRKVLTWKGLDHVSDDDIFTGHGLFSMLLPEDFEYSCKVNDENYIKISRGVLLTGTLHKVILGDSQSSIVHILEKEYSAQRSLQFVSEFQFVVNHWLSHAGFSVGISDCFLKTKVDVKASIDKAFIEANMIAMTEKDETIKEARINNALNSANSIGQVLCKSATAKDNQFNVMIASGSKGNFINVAQITGTIGQTTCMGSRIQLDYNSRSLPHFPLVSESDDFSKYTPEQSKQLYLSRGFIYNPFLEKLNAHEMWYNLAGGRVGVADTAIKTSTTGYSQRKLIKFLEDLKYTHGHCVTNAKNVIVQMTYANSNLDPSKMIFVDKTLQFVDVNSLVNKLNSAVEWNTAHSA